MHRPVPIWVGWYMPIISVFRSWAQENQFRVNLSYREFEASLGYLISISKAKQNKSYCLFTGLHLSAPRLYWRRGLKWHHSLGHTGYSTHQDCGVGLCHCLKVWCGKPNLKHCVCVWRGVCLHACLCMYDWSPRRPEESIRIPETILTDGCEPPHGC